MNWLELLTRAIEDENPDAIEEIATRLDDLERAVYARRQNRN